MSGNIGLQVRQAVPNLDPIVANYTVGYIQHLNGSTEDAVIAQQLDIAQELSFVHDLLVSSGGDKEKISAFTNKIQEEFETKLKENMKKLSLTGDTSKRLLDISLVKNQQRDINSSLALLQSTKDIAHGGRVLATKVDKKKLIKAEAKIAKKVAKRANKFVKYEASKLINEQSQEDYDSFFLKINPIDFGSAAGKSKDIKLDAFDLYVGDGKRILSDASLTLAYGRRYGLIGQNGIGKSTLLRALSRRELDIPKHVTILHVEQEIIGDDTPALQSVLDADVWRKQLLHEEAGITERIDEIEKESGQPPAQW